MEAGDEVVDAVVTASRAMIAVAVRSLTAAGDITLAQYRTLVVLACRDPQRLADLAEVLAVTPPTAGRMCDRLVRKGLITRHRARADRRIVRVSITPAGRQVVDEVTRRLRVFIAEILSELPARQRRKVAAALRVPAREHHQRPVLGEGNVPRRGGQRPDRHRDHSPARRHHRIDYLVPGPDRGHVHLQQPQIVDSNHRQGALTRLVMASSRSPRRLATRATLSTRGSRPDCSR